MLWHSPLSIISSAESMGKTEGFLSLRNGTKVNGGQQKTLLNLVDLVRSLCFQTSSSEIVSRVPRRIGDVSHAQ